MFQEETQVFCRILAARQDDGIGAGQVAGMAGIVQGDVVFAGQTVEIGEVGNLRHLDDGDRYLISFWPLFPIIEGYRILFIDAQVIDIGHDAQDGFARLFFQKVDGRREQRYVTAEFINDQAFDQVPFIRVEQFQRAD